MSRRFDNGIQITLAAMYTGGGVNHVVQTPEGHVYLVYLSGVDGNVVFQKSTDRCRSWSAPVALSTSGTVTQLALWYDRWSNISAGLIHCAYSDSTVDDTFYRSINTESSDALSSQTTIFAGASTATSSMLAITRASGGNLYCRTCIDAGVEGGFFRSTDVGGTWGSRTINEALAAADTMILLPGWAADNQDIMGIFWDASADEVSRQLYDDSANSWAETSIATTMVELVGTTGFPNFAAFVDIANSRNVVAAWSATDAANAKLRCWTVTESAITEVTNIVANSTDDQGLCAIGIATDTGYWWAMFCGKSDGSETWNTSMNIYAKVSTDSGATWSSEIQLTNTAKSRTTLTTIPRFVGSPIVFSRSTGSSGLSRVNSDLTDCRASHQLLGG